MESWRLHPNVETGRLQKKYNEAKSVHVAIMAHAFVR